MLSAGPSLGATAPNSLALRATYDVAAHIYWGRGLMTVRSIAHVTNTTQRNVMALTFNLVPLVTGDAQVVRVKVRDKPVDATTVGQTIVVPLAKPLEPEERTTVTIRYRARFNAVSDDRQQLFMESDGVLTAYRWIPWLSRRQAFAAPNFGETWVTAVSPRVTVTLTSREPLVYATSGRQTAASSHRRKFTANDVRDFNFSASADYRVKRARWHGVAIRVFYRSQDADQLASYAIAALRRFTREVGPYPYSHLNIAETPTATGMESPALSWISTTVDPLRLEALVTHEVAHQWFYAAVGNNQARNPFLDEAVSDFLTRNMLQSFRRSGCPKAALDGSVYDYSERCYPEVIYVQGARYLDKYRAAVGDEAFWTGLSQYYQDYLLRIGGTRSLLDALDAASGFDSAKHAERFPSLYP
jgi:aminopeptidase N